ncbi:MAG: hypothetical protein ABSG17_19435 [Spirochaetia bacterium]|jgi:hypothetical protein
MKGQVQVNLQLILLTITVAALLSACSTEMNITVDRSDAGQVFQSKAPTQEVQSLEIEDSVPADAVLVARLKLRDGGLTTDCGYDIVLNKAKAKARELGGDLIKILKVYPPDIISSCYQMDVAVYALKAEKRK